MHISVELKTIYRVFQCSIDKNLQAKQCIIHIYFVCFFFQFGAYMESFLRTNKIYELLFDIIYRIAQSLWQKNVVNLTTVRTTFSVT